MYFKYFDSIDILKLIINLFNRERFYQTHTHTIIDLSIEFSIHIYLTHVINVLNIYMT
jgi:hypothetical protein